MTAAMRLLSLISPGAKGVGASNLKPDKAITDLISELDRLLQAHVGNKVWSENYQAERCFSSPAFLTEKTGLKAHLKVHMSIAVTQLKKRFHDMRAQTGTVDANALSIHGPIIRDYLFDLQPIVHFLERRRDPGYVFFHGGSNPTVLTIELYGFSRQLAQAPLHGPIPVDYKLGQITAAFVLRQSLEAKFERRIAVDLTNEKGGTPKLRHGFHYEFIKSHPSHFNFNVSDFTLVKHVYDWASGVVHAPEKPLAWQLAFADDICGPLFRPVKKPLGQKVSVNNAVTVNNKDAMQQRFFDYFKEAYDHGTWSVHLGQPEADVV